MIFKLFDDYWYAWWMWDLTHHALYWAIVVFLARQFVPRSDNASLRLTPGNQQEHAIEPLRVSEDDDDYYFD